MEPLLILGGLTGLAALLTPAGPLPTEKEYNKALEKLATDANDPEANTTVGKYKAFVLGKYDEGMLFLTKSGDKTLRTLAEHERDEAHTASGPLKIGMGDEWVTAAKSFKPLYRIFYDRASYWYGLAWPDMKAQPVWGDKLRERLVRLYITNPAAAAAPPKQLLVPTGWKGPIAETKAARSSATSRSGQWAYAITGWKSPLPAYGAIEQYVAVKPGKYKISGWVISDGTDAKDSFLIAIQNANGTNLVLHPMVFDPDKPWWRKIESEVTVPAEGVRLGFAIVIGSKTGMIYVDDVSVVGEDGKELLKNPGFEDR